MSMLFRFGLERTAARTKGATTFNAPGVYQPPYGKTNFKMTARGATGTTGNGGTIANYNPATGGNYAGTNPGTGGNYAGTNPTTAGNANYNPTVQYMNRYETADYSPNGPPGGVSYTSNTTSAYFSLTPFSNNNTNSTYGQSAYYTVTVNGYSTVPGNIANYNSPTGGNARYNTYFPGNDYYNATIPGNANYNGGNAPVAGGSSVVLGVTLPGSPDGSLAPVIGPVYVPLQYTPSGTPIQVPPGGYVTIVND